MESRDESLRRLLACAVHAEKAGFTPATNVAPHLRRLGIPGEEAFTK